MEEDQMFRCKDKELYMYERPLRGEVGFVVDQKKKWTMFDFSIK